MALYHVLFETFLSNYADDNNLCSIGKELNIIKEKLQKDFKVKLTGSLKSWSLSWNLAPSLSQIWIRSWCSLSLF